MRDPIQSDLMLTSAACSESNVKAIRPGVESAARHPRPSLLIALTKSNLPSAAATIAIVSLDQVAKALLTPYLESQSGWQVWLVEPIVKLRLVHNSGFVFGMLSGRAAPWLVSLVVIVAIVAILYVFTREIQSPTLSTRIVFGLIFGGALGNLIDRSRLGYVVDYVDLGWWPVFNIADASINISIVIFIVLLVLGRVEKQPNVPSPFMG